METKKNNDILEFVYREGNVDGMQYYWIDIPEDYNVIGTRNHNIL
jgi:hypothetical protein